MARREMPACGLLLAAGRSRRMGRTKQLLPWPGPDGPSTVVAAAFDSLAPVCDRMFVTLGHDAQEVCAALGDRAFERVMCDADAPMFASVRAGLERICQWNPECGVLLLPADQPGIARGTIEAVLAEAGRGGDGAVTPEYRGRGGHPAWLSPAAIGIVLRDSGAGGLRGVWERHPTLRRRVEVDDPACARDLDTPEDYARASGST